MNVGSFHVPRNVPTLVPRLLKEASVNGKFEEEVTLMRKDGSTFQAVLSVYPVIRDGKQIGFMGRTRPLGPPTAIPVGGLWSQARRAPFLIASITPVLVGALAAWQIRSAFSLPFFTLCLLGAVFIHLGANMANDAWDFRSGNDANVHHLNPFAGGSRVLIRGVLNPRTHLAVAFAFLGLGSLIGIYLVTQVGTALLWIGIFGVAVAYSYVGPPLRLAHRGLGEIAVGLEFGPVTVLALLGIPPARKPSQGLQKAGSDPHALIPSNAGMIMATLATGVLLLIGLAIPAFVK